MGSHYATYSQEPALLIRMAKRAVDHMDTKVGAKSPILVYQGLSGVTLATAIAMEYYARTGTNPGMVYVRKGGETSHGEKVERANTWPLEGRQVIFVDDGIESGNTMRRMFRAFCKTFPKWMPGVAPLNIFMWRIYWIKEFKFNKDLSVPITQIDPDFEY